MIYATVLKVCIRKSSVYISTARTCCRSLLVAQVYNVVMSIPMGCLYFMKHYWYTSHCSGNTERDSWSKFCFHLVYPLFSAVNHANAYLLCGLCPQQDAHHGTSNARAVAHVLGLHLSIHKIEQYTQTMYRLRSHTLQKTFSWDKPIFEHHASRLGYVKSLSETRPPQLGAEATLTNTSRC